MFALGSLSKNIFYSTGNSIANNQPKNLSELVFRILCIALATILFVGSFFWNPFKNRPRPTPESPSFASGVYLEADCNKCHTFKLVKAQETESVGTAKSFNIIQLFDETIKPCCLEQDLQLSVYVKGLNHQAKYYDSALQLRVIENTQLSENQTKQYRLNSSYKNFQIDVVLLKKI